MFRLEEASYPAFPIISFLAFVLVLVPFPWHLQAWNAGTCLFMFWSAVGCLNVFINSVVWRKDMLDRAPIWCDISTRIIVGVAVALPASALCITRRLYKIASIRSVAITRADKYRSVAQDLAIGLGIPIIQMGIQYVVEGNRYNIFAQFGCYPVWFNTPLAYVISFSWPVILGLISAVYSALALRAFMQRRAEFSHFVAMKSFTRSPFTLGRYFRLMALATIVMALNVPIGIYSLVLNATGRKVHPWRGWDDAHFDYWIVDKIPSAIWRNERNAALALELSRWGVVGCALIFFCLFGFAVEARKRYHDSYVFLRELVGIPVKLISKQGKQGNTYYPTSKDGSLPMYAVHPPSTSSCTVTDASQIETKVDSKPLSFAAFKLKYLNRSTDNHNASRSSLHSDAVSLSTTLNDTYNLPPTPPSSQFPESINSYANSTPNSPSNARPPTPPPKP